MVLARSLIKLLPLLMIVFLVLFPVQSQVFAQYCDQDAHCSDFDCFPSPSCTTCSRSCNTTSHTCSSTCYAYCSSWYDWSACELQPNGQSCRSRRCASNPYDYQIDCNCCTCDDWSNSSCGNGVNGCGWGSRIQTRSCSPGGCGETEQCEYDSACPWPVQLRGQKVVEPGAQTPNPPAGFAVSLTGGGFTSSNPTANPYSFNWNSSSGATRTASVPTMAGYDTGYSICYQDNDCHGGSRTRNGSSMTLADNSIRSACGTSSTCYGDLWWHYCPILSTGPTNVQVTGQSPEGNVCDAANVTATWDAVPGAYHYQIIIDDLTNNGSRVRWATGSASLAISVTDNHRYHVSVRAQNVCRGPFTPAGENTFQMVQTPSPAPNAVSATDLINSVGVSWRDRTNDETHFFLTRLGYGGVTFPFPDVPPYGVRRAVVSTSGPAVSVMYNNAYIDAPPEMTLGGTYSYCLFAHNSTYPAACSTSASSSCDQVEVQDYSHAWFQVQGGDITAASGPLDMYAPPEDPPDGLPDPLLILNGEPYPTGTPAGVPGIIYGTGWGTGNIGSINPNRISSTGWRADVTPGWGSITPGGGSGMLDKLENKFPAIRMRVVSQAESFPVTTDIVNQSALTGFIDGTTAVNKVDGVAVLEREGDITFDNGGAATPINLENRQAILFVNGNVVINSPITLSNTGVWSVIASGNITIADGIGTARSDVFPYQANLSLTTHPADIVGVYYAGGILSTGVSDLQLKIDGSIIGMQGVTMGRTSLGAFPAEFVHFNPRITKILRDVGLRRIVRQELVAP